MKKIFTLFAVAAMAITASAQTYLVAFGVTGETNKGYTISGSTDDTRTVKLEDGTELPALSFNNNWGPTNENYIKLENEGGFKAGDIVSLQGAIANKDESKRGACVVFTIEGEGETRTSNNLYTTEDFPNLTLAPTNTLPVYTYTLEADQPVLYLGRNGNTRTQMTMISVVRSNTSAIENITVDENAPVEYYNLQGVRVANPENGLYIRKQGNTVTKVVL